MNHQHTFNKSKYANDAKIHIKLIKTTQTNGSCRSSEVDVLDLRRGHRLAVDGALVCGARPVLAAGALGGPVRGLGLGLLDLLVYEADQQLQVDGVGVRQPADVFGGFGREGTLEPADGGADTRGGYQGWQGLKQTRFWNKVIML